MGKELKKLIVDELTRRTREIDRCVLLNFRGLSADRAADVRARLRQDGISLKVVRNSLMARALANVGLDALGAVLDGPCALADGADDVISLSRVVTRLVNTTDGLTVLAGYGEGKVLSADDVRRLATVPSRPELVAHFLWASRAPVAAFAGTLSRLATRFTGLLDAVRRSRDQG